MAHLAQLRDELRRRRDDAEPNRFLKLALVRMQQGKLADGSEDSARAYLEAAKLAGASAAAFEEALQEFTRRVLTAGRLAIDQKNFNDADRLIAEARAVGVSAATLVPLQRDLSAARGQAGHEHTEQQKLVDLLQQRLSQGSVVEPQGDNALYYLSALRNADPKNAAIPPLSRLVQEQIIARARAALDRQRPKDAEPLLKLAADLGPSPDVTLLTAKLATARQADAGAAELVAPGSLKIKRAMQLEYPAAAVAKGVEGWVDLEFLVTAEGRVGTVEVLDSSPPGVFDSAAIAALKRARYEPPRRDGRAVAQRSRVRLSFRLKG
jgi:TonB family protein